MKLKPSMREKRRYLVFEVLSKKPVDGLKAFTAFEKQTMDFMGASEMAKASFTSMPKMWNQSAQRGMVRVNRKYVDHARASLCLVKKIGRQNATMKSVGISGMINKAKERYLR